MVGPWTKMLIFWQILDMQILISLSIYIRSVQLQHLVHIALFGGLDQGTAGSKASP